MGTAGQLGLTGGVQPIIIKQLKFNPTVWKTCLRLLMEAQSRNYAQTTPSADGVSAFFGVVLIF
jgi:hypothetical protein